MLEPKPPDITIDYPHSQTVIGTLGITVQPYSCILNFDALPSDGLVVFYTAIQVENQQPTHVQEGDALEQVFTRIVIAETHSIFSGPGGERKTKQVFSLSWKQEDWSNPGEGGSLKENRDRWLKIIQVRVKTGHHRASSGDRSKTGTKAP